VNDSVHVRIVTGRDALARVAAGLFLRAAEEAIAERARFVVALAGGSTPRATYERIAREANVRVDWSRVHFLLGDERCVPPAHRDSNAAMVRRALIDPLPVPPENVLFPPSPQACDASGYDALLATFFGAPAPSALRQSAIDLALLGVGADGHTASLFPGSPALRSERWATATVAPPGTGTRRRITLTLAALNTSRTAIVLAHGSDKRAAVSAALASRPGSAAPIARVRPSGGVTWVVDDEAAPEDAGVAGHAR
jgi:6-phosphogluconolactonase